MTRKQASQYVFPKDFKRFLLPKIQQQADRFEHHALLKHWLNNARIPPRTLLATMSPLMIEWVMGFRDYNTAYLTYPDRPDNTQFEKVINHHTREDATHSRLFLEDWQKLGLNTWLGWQCSDYMRSVMSMYDYPMKQQGLKLYALAHRYKHPFLRFGLMETIEVAGQKFFTATAPLAQQLTRMTGAPFRYFGPHHLMLESGHIENESVFFESFKYPHYLRQAHHLSHHYNTDFGEPRFSDTLTFLVEEVGQIFVDTFDAWHHSARDLFDNRNFYRQYFARESKAQKACLKKRHASTSCAFFFEKDAKQKLCMFESPTIKSSLGAIADHPLFKELTTSSHHVAWIITPTALVDLLGTAFIAQYYDWDYHSQCQFYAPFNAMMNDIASLGHALIHDWDKLHFNECSLGFETSDILAFKFLGQRCEQHRHHFALHFQSLLEEENAYVRYLMVYARIHLYACFVQKLRDCIDVSAYCQLALFNEAWFKPFYQKHTHTAQACEKKLTPQDKERLTAKIHDLISTFCKQLDAGLTAFNEGDKLFFDTAASGSMP